MNEPLQQYQSSKQDSWSQINRRQIPCIMPDDSHLDHLDPGALDFSDLPIPAQSQPGNNWDSSGHFANSYYFPSCGAQPYNMGFEDIQDLTATQDNNVPNTLIPETSKYPSLTQQTEYHAIHGKHPSRNEIPGLHSHAPNHAGYSLGLSSNDALAGLHYQEQGPQYQIDGPQPIISPVAAMYPPQNEYGVPPWNAQPQPMERDFPQTLGRPSGPSWPRGVASQYQLDPLRMERPRKADTNGQLLLLLTRWNSILLMPKRHQGMTSGCPRIE